MPTLDHPVFKLVRAAFPGTKFLATEYRGQSSLIVEPASLLAVMTFLKTDKACDFNFLSDLAGVDYLNYPGSMPGRFGVVYNLVSMAREDRFWVKTYLNPSMPTEGTAADPALVLDSVTGLWPGAEWMEREVFDMFGIRFRNHPDLRRILLWEEYPGHPLRKDYPVRGRGEREMYRIVDRTSS
jgi:NADH-quinone oxidoreductase subunit C